MHLYNNRQTMLDFLPLEICERIASYVTEGRLSTDGLNLAEISPHQREAVVSTLHHSICLEPSTASVSRWARVVYSDLRELNILHPLPYNGPQRSPEVQLLTSPSLRSASIPDDPRYLRTIAKTSGLTCLNVRIFRNSCQQLLDVVHQHQLLELHLVCMHKRIPDHDCPVLYSRKDHTAFSRRCPSVQVLELNCWLWKAEDVWPVFGSFPALTELTLTSDLPNSILGKLSKLKTVHLESNSIQLAHAIGASVSSINGMWIGSATFTRKAICKLAACPKLESLSVKLADGAEIALPDLAVANLRSLSLTWSKNRIREYSIFKSQFYSPRPGALLDIVTRSPNLRDLRLPGISLPTREWLKILRAIGSHLRIFEANVNCQEEGCCNLLLKMLLTAARFNRNVSTLQFLSSSSSLHAPRHEDPVHSRDFQYAHFQFGSELLYTVERLHRFTPSLQIKPLRIFVENLIRQPCDCHEKMISSHDPDLL